MEHYILAFIMLLLPFDLCYWFFLNVAWDDLLTNGGDVSTQNPSESAIVSIVPKMETREIDYGDPLDPRSPTKN